MVEGMTLEERLRRIQAILEATFPSPSESVILFCREEARRAYEVGKREGREDGYIDEHGDGYEAGHIEGRGDDS